MIGTGNELDEFQTHRFLEGLGETLTVVAMRDRMRQIDLDFNKKVALIEYLTVRYGKNVKQIVDAPQGDQTEASVSFLTSPTDFRSTKLKPS